jgi:predicted Zn finger-like uncharacterized protein
VAAITACPNCQRQLKVPENLLGKTVRCPSCQTTFVAQDDQEAPVAMVDEEPANPTPGPGASPEMTQRRRVRASAAAASALMGPAISLLIFGVLAILGGFLGGAIYGLVLPNAPQMNNPQFGGPPPPPAALYITGVLSMVGGCIWGGLVIAGAISMLRLRLYPLAMTGSIVAMMPCSGCCLVGLPLGIWALIILNREEVRAAFT